VLLALERRKEAYQAFLKGLAVQKNHQGILREVARMGWRKKPIVPFLDRKNPVNVALGKMLRESRKDGAKRPA